MTTPVTQRHRVVVPGAPTVLRRLYVRYLMGNRVVTCRYMGREHIVEGGSVLSARLGPPLRAGV